MKWFDIYSSNTLAGSGNQHYFLTGDDEVHKGRIYYKLFAGGTYNYSLLFSNIMDSTYSDGTVSHCNLICPEWELVQVRVGVCATCNEALAAEPGVFYDLTFGGNKRKYVAPGEFFTSDPVKLCAQKGEYLCVEIAFRGSMIPHHEQSILPVFTWEDGKWSASKQLPFPGMIGCDRKVSKKVGFIGDSITQGIGTPVNAYTHWNALVAEAIGEQYSYWNLGIGFGRAQDAGSDSAWLYKAKQCDAVVVCFGTNDVGQGRSVEQIKEDLMTIVTKLQDAGVRVLIQTLPPFSWEDEKLQKWQQINAYIRETMVNITDAMFDVVPILIDGKEDEGKDRYGGHPDEAGCAAWAEALIPVLGKFLEQ